MGALAEVIAEIRHTLERISAARAHLTRAVESLTNAHRTYAVVLTGTTDVDARRIAQHAELANSQVLDQDIGLGHAERLLGSYLSGILGNPIPEQVIERTRAALRPGVERAQTTGWWLRRDGSRIRLRSGDDQDPTGWQQKARRFLRERFPNAGPHLFELSRHVEIKLAIRSHDLNFEHEVVVIDRRVCGRDARSRTARYTCDKLLPFVLAEGAALTVVENDGTRVTYIGRHRV